MHHEHVVLFGQRHHALEKIQLDALRRRVGWKAENHHLRLGNALADAAFEFRKKIDARRHRDRADLRARDHRAVDVDRVTGIGHQHGVAAIERGQHQVRQPFFRTDGDNGFAVRIDLHAIALAVPARDGAAQARYALGGGITVRIGPLRHSAQLLDDMRRRGAIRIAHAEVDDVFAAAARGHLQLGSDIEDVRGKTFDAFESTRCRTRRGQRQGAVLAHGKPRWYVSARNRPSDVGMQR